MFYRVGLIDGSNLLIPKRWISSQPIRGVLYHGCFSFKISHYLLLSVTQPPSYALLMVSWILVGKPLAVPVSEVLTCRTR